MLYSEAIKTIAESLSRLAEDANKKGQYTDLLAGLTEIINDEIEMPTAEKSASAGERYHYDGLDELDKPVNERGDDFGVITFAVTKGGAKILEFSTNNDCTWVMAKDDAGNWYPCSQIKINTKTKWTASYSIRKFANNEEKDPGSFAKKYIPTRPVIVRKSESKD